MAQLSIRNSVFRRLKRGATLTNVEMQSGAAAPLPPPPDVKG